MRAVCKWDWLARQNCSVWRDRPHTERSRAPRPRASLDDRDQGEREARNQCSRRRPDCTCAANGARDIRYRAALVRSEIGDMVGIVPEGRRREGSGNCRHEQENPTHAARASLDLRFRSVIAKRDGDARQQGRNHGPSDPPQCEEDEVVMRVAPARDGHGRADPDRGREEASGHGEHQEAN